MVLLVVADGVGGAPGGEVAADAAVNELAQRFFSAGDGRAIEDRLIEGIRDANTAVLKAGESSGFPGAATTLVAAVVQGARVVVANLGDSRAYLVRAGEARQLTDDHHGAFPGGITRFLGDPRGVQPDIFVETLQPADRLILCSDGLTRHVQDAEIAAAMRDDPARAADALVALARSRGGEDNVTVIVYAARRPAISRAVAGTLILALLILVAVAGAMGALLATPVPAPAASASPPASAGPSPSEPASPSVAPSPSAAP